MSEEGKLKHCLIKYKNPDSTRREVLNVTSFYKSLAFKYDKFTFNDGTCMELVSLEGTVPVLYKGSVYNIPVCIWLMDTHPNHAPLCFVKPTPDMSIKVSKYVDNNGRVYLPYLHDWKGGDSNLLTLIKYMIVAFGEIPPVYSKPPGEPAVKQPPYPTSSYMPQPGGQQPYLPYPSYQQNTNMPPYPPSSGPAYPTFNSPYPAYPQANFSPYPPGNPANSAYPPYPGPTPNTGTGTITEEHIKASLFSAVEDKLRRRFREQQLQNQAELETLRRTQRELTDGKGQLDEILNRLDKESSELDKNIAILEEKEQELQNSIEKLSEQESINPDDAVTTTSPLYTQLLSTYAEEATTEDAIYYMGEALRTGVIDLDAFLKQVRALSRKQFTLRALMQKCRQKAGLAC